MQNFLVKQALTVFYFENFFGSRITYLTLETSSSKIRIQMSVDSETELPIFVQPLMLKPT